MKRILFFLLFTSIIVISCGQPGLSPEEVKMINDLKNELQITQQDISDSESQYDNIRGGLIKALIDARVEILKINEALLKQRIHALESNTKVTLEIKGTSPDQEEATKLMQEMENQEDLLKAAREEASNYSRGLIAAIKLTTVATHEQTLAMLRQKYLIAKYGLAHSSIKFNASLNNDNTPQSQVIDEQESNQSASDDNIAYEIVSVKLLKKQFAEQDYQKFIFFDLQFIDIGLDKAARAIKGTLNIQDLFGETKCRIGFTIDKPLKQKGNITIKGAGFKFNQFVSSHQWVRATKLKNIKASFTVKNIIYSDGTSRNL